MFKKAFLFLARLVHFSIAWILPLAFLSSILLATDENIYTIKSYVIHDNRAIEISIPKSWKDSICQASPEIPPTITLSPQKGNNFEILISAFWSLKNEKGFNNPQKIHAMVEEMIPIVSKSAPDSEISTIQEMKGPENMGYFYTAYDKAPRPNEYKYLTQGAVGLGDIMLIFSIFYNQKDSIDMQIAMEAIKNAKYKSTSKREMPSLQQSEFALTYPGKDWSLIVDLSDFNLSHPQLSDDGLGIMISGKNENLGLYITIFLEKAEFSGDALAAREYYLKMDKMSPVHKKDIKLSERGDMTLFEYFVPTYRGEKINQKHINAFLVKDDLWIDIHISKLAFNPEDYHYFDKVLKSVRISE